MKKPLILFIFLSFLLLYKPTYGQQQEYPEAYRMFDSTISRENTNLLAGKEYIEQHPVINDKHKFYKTTRFFTGSITYQNQTYDKVDLRYNIFDDLLIARIPKRNGQATFQLFTNRVQSFKIDNKKYVNIRLDESGKEAVTGFFEVLNSNKTLSIYKKHRKKSKKMLDRDFVYYEFEADEPLYAIKYKDNYYIANSERNWKQIFPEQKQLISKIYKREKDLQRQKPDLFIKNLANKIQENLSSGLWLKNYSA